MRRDEEATGNQCAVGRDSLTFATGEVAICLAGEMCSAERCHLRAVPDFLCCVSAHMADGLVSPAVAAWIDSAIVSNHQRTEPREITGASRSFGATPLALLDAFDMHLVYFDADRVDTRHVAPVAAKGCFFSLVFRERHHLDDDPRRCVEAALPTEKPRDVCTGPLEVSTTPNAGIGFGVRGVEADDQGAGPRLEDVS